MSLLRCIYLTKHSLLSRIPTILQISQCRVRIEPEPAKLVPKSESIDYYDEKNMEKNRPLSPYISIYATQLQGVQSIHNRITGAIWTFELAAFAIAALVLPESVEYYVDKINSWNLDTNVIYACKALIAWPMVYHTVDGTRHLLWDFGMVLTNKSVMISGWLVFVLSIVGTLYLSLMV